MELQLTPSEAASAAAIQAAIDRLADTGGRLILPEMDLTLDRGLALRSGVELVGQGERTVLRKGPGAVYPLSGYHNYGMCDVPLHSAAGLEVGMTVSVHDNSAHGGFYETFGTITSIDGNWVGLDHGLEADYHASDEPCLTTVYPLVFAHQVEDAAVRNLHLEGSRASNEKAMGGCRGGAVYFAKCRNMEVSDVVETDYYGEGLSFQMCSDVRILRCRFGNNSGTGLHPGAGSTDVLFEDCEGSGNDRCGFFFCVRANHITVRGCTFRRNRVGISIGTRDCHNVINSCTVEDNAGAGVLVRATPSPTEVHSCRIENCAVRGNAAVEGRGQVEIVSEAHDLVFVNNDIQGHSQIRKAGFYLGDNRIADCDPEVEAEAASLASTEPAIECGYGTASSAAFRHLPGLAGAV